MADVIVDFQPSLLYCSIIDRYSNRILSKHLSYIESRIEKRSLINLSRNVDFSTMTKKFNYISMEINIKGFIIRFFLFPPFNVVFFSVVVSLLVFC